MDESMKRLNELNKKYRKNKKAKKEKNIINENKRKTYDNREYLNEFSMD
jgi:hypothetical protein